MVSESRLESDGQITSIAEEIVSALNQLHSKNESCLELVADFVLNQRKEWVFLKCKVSKLGYVCSKRNVPNLQSPSDSLSNITNLNLRLAQLEIKQKNFARKRMSTSIPSLPIR